MGGEIQVAEDLAALANKFGKLANSFDGASLRQITTRVATKAKPVATEAVSPNTLSHWGKGGRKGGYKVQARYKVISDHEAVIQPTVPPLAGLLEHGSGTTWKAPKRRGSKRRKRGTVRSYTRSRVPARHAWSKVYPPVRAVVPREVDNEMQRVLRSVF